MIVILELKRLELIRAVLLMLLVGEETRNARNRM
jgi:hypothetical protein